MLKLTRTGGEDRFGVELVQPAACSVSHNVVQALEDSDSGYWPELPCAIAIGDRKVTVPSARIRSGTYPPSDAVGVGQDEDPAPAVASARFSRCEQARLWRVAHVAKVSRDVGKSQSDVSFDILTPHPLGSGFIDDAGDFGPEVARILAAPPFSSGAEGLAWIAG